MNRLYALGELLIDFQSEGHGGLKDTERFVKKAGGAPANVVAQAAKLGCPASYLTKVGEDGFGDFLIESIRAIGVDVSYIRKDPEHPTSLAFVSIREDGEREFSFYRQAPADLMISPEDFKGVAFSRGDIFEFGSVALASEQSRQTHDYLIQKAEDAEAIIAFDPNLRLNLWKDAEELKRLVLEYAKEADIIKIGKDELEFVTGLGEEAGVKA